MEEMPARPDLSTLDVPMDAWTQPFWDGAAQGKLLLPRCGKCRHFRWPPGPFCPHCQSQQTEWLAPGTARIYSFTVVRARAGADQPPMHVPALVEFPEADGVRLLAAIVDTPLSAIRIGAALNLEWSQAINAMVPVFSVAAPATI